MSKNDVGALLVFSPRVPHGIVADSGTKLDALVTSQLLESIFHPPLPLHDGAVLVVGNRVIAAGCFLQLSQQPSIPKEYGTRHRAGLGITEENSEMISLIVSEETGIISIAENGVLRSYADTKLLHDTLYKFYSITGAEKSAAKGFWWKR